MFHLKMITAAAALLLSAAPLFAATYSAAGNAMPGAPFERFDANHVGSTFPLSPYFGKGYTPSPDHSAAGGIYSSGQSDQGRYTFWFDPSQTLNTSAGVDLAARLKVTSSSVSADLAGVAIALTDSMNHYAEVYLGTGEIFINGAGRVRDEAHAMDTTDGFHDYLVRVRGTDVSVYVDGTLRLTGNSFFAATGSAPTLANWAVLGDITSSAAGAYEMQSFAVLVPEPSALTLIGTVGVLAMRRGRRLGR